MISKGNKKAFTLAEMMIVLLVLTILFAIMAPLFTKKMTKDKISVWNWVDTNQSYSAYFDGDNSAEHDMLSQAFFGLNPSGHIDDTFDPYSKVVIRAYYNKSKAQNQIHFRGAYKKDRSPDQNFNGDNYDFDESIGANLGTMLLETRNILVGGNYDHLYDKDTIGDIKLPSYNTNETVSLNSSTYQYPSNNITFGNKAKNDLVHIGPTYALKADGSVVERTIITNSDDNIAIGYKAGTLESHRDILSNNPSSTPVLDLDYHLYGYNFNDNLYVGYQAGYIDDYEPDDDNFGPSYYIPYFLYRNKDFNYANILGQTMIGSGAGYRNFGIFNTAIGYNAGKNLRGKNNVFVGSNAGAFANFIVDKDYDGDVQDRHDDFEVSDNVAIGYNALNNLRPIHSLSKDGEYRSYKNNIAIGAEALSGLEAGYNNVAIGAGACKYLKYSANKICIGANSGPKPLDIDDDSPEKYFLNATTPEPSDGHQIVTPINVYDDDKDEEHNPIRYDTTQRVYIGGKPKNFGGDAVLEIHDSDTATSDGSIKSFLMNNPTMAKVNATTVINGNLVVRGKTFFTVGDYLYNFSPVSYRYFSKTQPWSVAYSMYNYYVLGSDINDAIVCADNPFTYTFGGYSDKFTGSGAQYSDLTSLSYLHKRYEGYAEGCPRVYYNQRYDEKMPGYTTYGGVALTYPNTRYALHPLHSSDRRLKNIGSKSNAGLAEIMKLKVFNFKFKDDEKKTPHVGVIAQDLMKIFPNSVKTNEKGFLTIKLDEMFFAAINAIKELDRMIVSYTKRLFKIETEITKLEAENAELKTQVEALTLRVNKIKASRGL